MEMRSRIDSKKLEAEAMARAKADRENQDLKLEQLRLKASEHRTTVLEAIKSVQITIIVIYFLLKCVASQECDQRNVF